MMSKLDSLSLAANTILVFTSDNGGLHVPEGTHRTVTHNSPFRAGKGFLYEGGLRIPLIVRWPGRIQAGRTVDAAMVNTDWLSTLLDLAGLAAPSAIDGMSCAEMLLENRQSQSRAMFWHFPHYTNQGGRPAGAVRVGEWKLIEHYEDGGIELFNLVLDPGETRNLGASEPRRAKELQAQLRAWRTAVGAQSNAPNPDFDPALHRALYLDVDPSLYNAATADAAARDRMSEWRRRMDGKTKGYFL